MSIITKADLKVYFTTGAKPTESNFSDLVNNLLHVSDDLANQTDLDSPGPSTLRYVNPNGVKSMVEKFAPVQKVNGIAPTNGEIELPDADANKKGLAVLATDTEIEAGTSTTKVVTPSGLKIGVAKWESVKKIDGILPDANGNIDLGGSSSLTQPILQNNLNNFDASTPVQYIKKNGIVYLQGILKDGDTQNGSSTTYLLFTLPAGFQPTQKMVFPTINLNKTLGRVDIDTNGNVYGVIYDNGGMSLSGISFIAK